MSDDSAFDAGASFDFDSPGEYDPPVHRWICMIACGCHALPPPPLVPVHADTAPGSKGSTTMIIVVGGVLEGLGGGGLGVALRVEHQQLADTAVGIELGGGYGSGQTSKPMLFSKQQPETAPLGLVAVRGYGRTAPIDRVALTYGLGLSVMNTGLVTGSAHGGIAATTVTGSFQGIAGGGLMIARPLRDGRPFGIARELAGAAEYGYVQAGFLARDSGSDNPFSLEVGVAIPIRSKGSFESVSAAYGLGYD